jgi:hypothetical protein
MRRSEFWPAARTSPKRRSSRLPSNSDVPHTRVHRVNGLDGALGWHDRRPTARARARFYGDAFIFNKPRLTIDALLSTRTLLVPKMLLQIIACGLRLPKQRRGLVDCGSRRTGVSGADLAALCTTAAFWWRRWLTTFRSRFLCTYLLTEPRHLIVQFCDPSGGRLCSASGVSALGAQRRVGTLKLRHSGAQLILADRRRASRRYRSAFGRAATFVKVGLFAPAPVFAAAALLRPGLRPLPADLAVLDGLTPRAMVFSSNWLRVSGTTKMPQVDKRICHQLHAIVPLLDELEPQQQAFEFILPREGPLHAQP